MTGKHAANPNVKTLSDGCLLIVSAWAGVLLRREPDGPNAGCPS